MRYQIRDDNFGLAIQDAESPVEALLDFLADRARGQLRPLVRVYDDGAEASIDVDGERFYAVSRDPKEADR